MNAWRHGSLLLLLCLLWGPLRAGADNCFSCQKPLLQKFYKLESTGFLEAQLVCHSCYQIKERCAICSLPSTEWKQLSDGRRFCRHHAAAAILNESDAQRLFEGTKREVFPLLDGLGKLPTRNITVRLANAAAMKSFRRQIGPAPAGYDTMGLTHSQQSPDGVWTHTIYVLTGLPESTMMSVLAHEYAHVWLNENLPKDRKVQVDTVEGFCELVAHKVMQQRRDALHVREIEKNGYSKGQVSLLLQAQGQHQFHRVVKWMLQGTEPTMSTQILGQRPEKSARTTRAPGTPSPQAVPTPVPDELTLKGISGRPGHYLALINDTTLQRNESGKVRVGDKSVRVRCLEITQQSATLQIEGRSEPLTLHLRTGG